MKFYISILPLLFIFFQSLTAHAHPGNTDGNGGHTCRTNCPDWGLNYGEYHYHYGDSSTNSNSSSSSSSYDSIFTDEEIMIDCTGCTNNSDNTLQFIKIHVCCQF